MITNESKNFDINSPRGKSIIIKEISKLLSVIPDEIEKEEYIKYLSSKTSIPQETIEKYVEENSQSKEEIKPVQKKPLKPNAEIYLLDIILNDQTYLEQIIEKKEKLTEKLKKVVEAVEILINKNIKPTVANIIGIIDDEQILNLISNVAIEDNLISEDKKRKIFDDCLKKVEEISLKETLNKRKKEIFEKGPSPSKNELEEIQTIIYQLQKGR